MNVRDLDTHAWPAVKRSEADLGRLVPAAVAGWPARITLRLPTSISDAAQTSVSTSRPIGPIEIEIAGVRAGGAPPAETARLGEAFVLIAGDHHVGVRIDAGLAGHVTARLLDLPAPVVPRSLSAAERGVLSAAMAVSLAELGIGARLLLSRTVTPGATQAPTVEVDLALRIGSSIPDDPSGPPVRGSVRISVPAAALRRSGGAPSWPRLVNLPIPIVIEAATTTIAASDLAGLAVGDAVVFDGHAAVGGTDGSGPADISVRIGAFRARARLDENRRLRLTSVLHQIAGRDDRFMTKENTTMGDQHDSTTIDAAPAAGHDGGHAGLARAIASTPIEVTAELGRICLRGEDLAGLTSGVVLALGNRLSDPVMLTVGGIPIARGALVDVDGQFGVRVTETLTAR